MPQTGSTCTEDCSWDAVAANTSYCCPIKGAINTSEALVAECQGYKVLLKRGLDAGVVKYYDATTGSLVASATTGASPCGSVADCDTARLHAGRVRQATAVV